MPACFHGKTAAVSLTYDDALDDQLDVVLPALESRGLRATFYTPIVECLIHRRAEWSAAAARGHELGNHTLFHPCRHYPGANWIFPARDLKLYDTRRWEMEVDVANLVLSSIDGRTDRTFGNTCHHNTVGPDEDPVTLDPLMRPRFLAARGTLRDRHYVIDPARANLDNLGTVGGDGLTAAELTGIVDRAIDLGGWVIFTFHHVGPVQRYLTIAEKTHDALLDHLVCRREEVWTAPVREIVSALSPP